jgi:hypothetical protein
MSGERKPDPTKTGVGEFCQPGDRREPRWMVMYDDVDRGHSVFDNEQDAREAFANSEGMGWNCWLFGPTPRVSGVAADESAKPFQARVQPWMMACFGAEIAADAFERNHRFLEEALELVQACGATASEAHQLVDYVYGRPVGEKAQEVGGVMVTLAALCLAQDLDMHASGETELARIWTKVEAIRAKQAAKPRHSPLPMHVETVLLYPVELTADLREVLGWMCFQCISIAQCLRADGIEIAKRAEDEQATVIHWLTKFVLKHGAEWRPHAGEALKAMRERVAQRDASKAEGKSS